MPLCIEGATGNGRSWGQGPKACYTSAVTNHHHGGEDAVDWGLFENGGYQSLVDFLGVLATPVALHSSPLSQ